MSGFQMSAGARAARASLLACLCLVLGGCVTAPLSVAGASGSVKLEGSARRTLRVLSQQCERDSSGRLVVLVRFANTSSRPLKARLRVKFRMRDGLWEKGSYDMRETEIPAGESAFEWSSYTPEAASYEIEVYAAKFAFW